MAASAIWWPQPSPKITALAREGIDLRFRNKPIAQRGRLWARLRRQPDALSEEIAWVRRQRPDLVVVSQGGNSDGWAWMRFCRDEGLPFVAIMQCNYEEWWPTDEGRDDFAACYHAARKVYCVSKRNLELLERQIGGTLPSAVVVWNPCATLSDSPPGWPVTNHVCKLACVARLEPAAKGQDLLFQVLACPPWRERSVEVNLYGRGAYEKSLQQLAHYFQLPNLRFRGHVEDVRSIWQENHLLVLLSRYEGLPLALVEAMRCERPAVVTDVGGSAELCVNEETGFVAPAPTVKLVAEAMERAWNRRADWQAMGSAARERVERLVPKDPVGVFCQRLLECISTDC